MNCLSIWLFEMKKRKGGERKEVEEWSGRGLGGVWEGSRGPCVVGP